MRDQLLHVLNLGVEVYLQAHFGQGSGDIWLDDLHCNGTESSILNCTHNGIGVYGQHCTHDRVAGVNCLVGEYVYGVYWVLYKCFNQLCKQQMLTITCYILLYYYQASC